MVNISEISTRLFEKVCRHVHDMNVWIKISIAVLGIIAAFGSAYMPRNMYSQILCLIGVYTSIIFAGASLLVHYEPDVGDDTKGSQ